MDNLEKLIIQHIKIDPTKQSIIENNISAKVY